jgi:hypothetical protein
MSGNDCPRPDGIFAEYAATGSPDTPFTRSRSGDWSVTALIPDGAWGRQSLGAFCEIDGTGEPLYTYPQNYNVTISSPFSLDVQPDGFVTPGTALTVKPTQSFCTSFDTILVGVSVRIPVHGGLGVHFLIDPVLASPDETSSNGVLQHERWHAGVTIPDDAKPGRYYVVASCADSRSSPGIFAPVRINVTK